jgi:hypothetical protein
LAENKINKMVPAMGPFYLFYFPSTPMAGTMARCSATAYGRDHGAPFRQRLWQGPWRAVPPTSMAGTMAQVGSFRAGSFFSRNIKGVWEEQSSSHTYYCLHLPEAEERFVDRM